MLLPEYNLNNWDKYKIDKSVLVGDTKVLVLKLQSIEKMAVPKEGVKNLLAINNNNENILWIADIPKGFGGYISFDNVRFQNNKLEAWCDSIYSVIDIKTGEILSSEFVK